MEERREKNVCVCLWKRSRNVCGHFNSNYYLSNNTREIKLSWSNTTTITVTYIKSEQYI